MTHGVFRVPQPINEPVKSFAPGSAEKLSLKKQLKAMSGEAADIPLVIGGREVRTGKTETIAMLHNHRHSRRARQLTV